MLYTIRLRLLITLLTGCDVVENASISLLIEKSYYKVILKVVDNI